MALIKLKFKKGERRNNFIYLGEGESKLYRNLKQRRIICQCDCGNKVTKLPNEFQYGKTKSCKGCLKGESLVSNRTHNLSDSRIYRIWYCIKTRCYNSNHWTFEYYGGRGIKCLWKTFEEFYNDMGSSYLEGLTIDRINVDGHYCKENCRRITQEQQNKNKRNSIRYNGKSLSKRATLMGVSYGAAYNRYKSGKSLENMII